MSAMGERFLILEETADALDVMDPDLARQFRFVNGLHLRPEEVLAETEPRLSSGPLPRQHRIRMDEDVDGILVECSCGDWSTAVGWDGIDELVIAVRDHLAAQDTLDEAVLIGGNASVAPEAPVVEDVDHAPKSTDRRRAS
ncbi:MAG: hypothetical protein ABSC90_06735 [Acidimicrobiales bacterium]|jgi:hypothetical protein